MNIVRNQSCIRAARVVVVLILLVWIGNAASQDGGWSYLAEVGFARTGLYGDALNGKIYAIGGSEDASSATAIVEEYDPQMDIWTRKDDMPEAITFGATAVTGGKIYLISGAASPYAEARNDIYAYEPGTGTWESIEEMPTPRILPATGVVDGKIYVIGGSLSASNAPVTTVEVYDPQTDSWTKKTDMPTARYGLSASVVDGKIYAIGGTTEDFAAVSYATVEEYDPETDTWSTKKKMPTARWGLATCTLDNQIYAIGGQTGFAATHKTVEIYDPKTDNWEIASSLQTGRRVFPAAVLEGKIYAIAGSHSIPGVALSSVEVFSPTEPSSVLNSNNNIPTKYKLYLNFPNPFSSRTVISYQLPLMSDVELSIYNLLEQKVTAHVKEKQQPGSYEIEWNAYGMKPGIYYCELKTDIGREVMKMILLSE